MRGGACPTIAYREADNLMPQTRETRVLVKADRSVHTAGEAHPAN